MKFSYKLLKQLVPKLPNPEKTAELLSAYLFETKVASIDALEVDILPNRYSDAASHWGLARELGAILGCPVVIPASFVIPAKALPTGRQAGIYKAVDSGSKSGMTGDFDVLLKTKLCNRLTAWYFGDLEIKPSPKWLQETLLACGMQPINNLVDITNYVTLETGQPLHAFDFDKMAGGKLIVRPAKAEETVTSLDNVVYQLTPNNLVLADERDALDVAGIKGGKKAEITGDTKNILLTAGNFNGVSIYKTSRQINLVTDASARFAHNISPELVEIGINRAAQLVKELCGGLVGLKTDVYQRKPQRRLIKFDIDKVNRLSGLNLKEKQAVDVLKKLGFRLPPPDRVRGRNDLLVEPPAIRTDIERLEDLAEEIIRLYGYENISTQPPRVMMRSSEFEDQIILKDNIRKTLTSFGWDEVYNYSLIGEPAALELENPISQQYTFLRPSLLPGLTRNLDDNLRFQKRVMIFEIGHVFNKLPEHVSLGLAIVADKDAFWELKGALTGLLEQLGLVEFLLKEAPESNRSSRLIIESDHKEIGAVIHQSDNKMALAEINLDGLLKLVTEEKSYEPLPRYPSIMRDISLLVPQVVRFSEIMSLIENIAPKYLDDVDLIDFYEDKKFSLGQRSLTFRLVFLDRSRTLTDKEVDEEVKKITGVLARKLGVEVR